VRVLIVWLNVCICSVRSVFRLSRAVWIWEKLISVLRGGFLVRLVGPRLGLLGDDHERAGVERHGREHEVEQDEGGGIEAASLEQPCPGVA
jgi:hypothetical protein